MCCIVFYILHLSFIPLKIYNRTGLAVPVEIQEQRLPINELNGTHFKYSPL